MDLFRHLVGFLLIQGGGYKSLLRYRIQESDTKGFQDQNHDLALSGIPKKLGKDALLLGENQVVR